MKKYVQYSLAFLGLSALVTPSVHALIGPATTTGGTSGQTFPTALLSKSFHKPSGSWFSGLTTGAGDNAICYATRPASPDLAPTFTGIAGSTATNPVLNNATIPFLTVVQNPADRASVPTAYIVTTTGIAPTSVFVLTATAQNNSPQQAVMLDAAGNVTGAMLGLTGGVSGANGCAFAAVKSNGATTNFAAGANDVLRIANIDTVALSMITSFTPCTATATQGVFAAGAAATATGSTPALHYDETFGLLYVGLNQIVSGAANTNAATSIAIYQVTSGATPTLVNIPLTGGALGTVFTFSQIVGGSASVGSGAATLSVNKIKTMHTSTTPSGASSNFAYLIVNGGNGATTATGNQVYALPLVVNNATAANNGKLANVLNYTTSIFDLPAAAANKLYTNTSPEAIVGNGVLPMAATGTVADMWVDGDAVFCSISGAASATNCPGVWKSQALFDNDGAIVFWTDWEKVTPAGYSATGSNIQTAVTNFAVDAYTGQIWGMDNTKLNLYLTGFNNTATPTAGLVGFLNSTLEDGCFSVLDMNSSVTAWGASNSIRMSLFGGVNTVCFAMTGSAVYGNNTNPFLAFNNGANSDLTSTATTVLTDGYLNTLTNYVATGTNIGLVTIGLPGRVNCLGYSGWNAVNASNTTPGFFLAGIQPEAAEDGSLYAYVTSAGRGFNSATQISDLANGFFAPSNNNAWKQLTNVVGTPVRILSRGGALYVLTQSVTEENGRTDYIFRATLTDTLTNLNNSFVAIATSGNGSDLGNATRFYDFLISSTAGGTPAATTGTEQLLLLTDDGIYTTTGTLGTQHDYGASTTAANLQLFAGWEQATGTEDYVEMALSESDRQRNPHTFWASSFAQNANTPYYNSQVLSQTNSTYAAFGSIGAIQINPSLSKTGVFNSDSTTSFELVPLLCNSIYSDGSRRFLVYANNINKHQLAVLPYNVDESAWNVTDPQAPIASSALSNVTAFYWIAQIGSTGKLMMGTNNGVVSLE